MPNCPECNHAEEWHLHSDGPLKRPCNKPGCRCDGKELDHVEA